MVLEVGFRDLPQVIVCMDRKLNVVIEGSPPLRYKCYKTGHVRNNCEEPEGKEEDNQERNKSWRDEARRTETK